MDNGDETSALSDYAALVRQFPNSSYAAEAHARIGYVYSRRSEHARAAEHYEDAARLAGGAGGGEGGRRNLYSAGVARLNSGDVRKAEEHFAALVETDPAGPWGVEAAYHLGEARYEAGDFKGARDAYGAAMRYGDGKWAFESAYATGWTWFRESNWEQAVSAFERAAALAPSAEEAARAEYRIGLSRASDGAWESALDAYKKALEVSGVRLAGRSSLSDRMGASESWARRTKPRKSPADWRLNFPKAICRPTFRSAWAKMP